MNIWIVVSNNFPFDPQRQSAHFYETESEAVKFAENWAGHCPVYIGELKLIDCLNMLGQGHYSNLDRYFPLTRYTQHKKPVE